MKKLRTYLEPMIQLTDEEWKEATNFYTLHTFQKGESIREAGEICNQAYYLAKGAVRSYMITDEGKERTLMVHINKKDIFLDPFFGDFISYITQSEGEFFNEALEPCEVYITDYKNIENLYESNIRWMKLGKLVAEEQLVKLVERKKWSTLDATKRYKYIQKHKPLYEKFLPDYQLASLLNITPQSLSRIKNSL